MLASRRVTDVRACAGVRDCGLRIAKRSHRCLHLLRRGLALAAALALAWGRPAPLSQAQAAGPIYVVQLGDTLYDIALRFGLTVEALQAANAGLQPDALGVGQQLVIPGFEGVAGNLDTHALEAGESLESLALRLGLSRETLVRLNRLVLPERLYLNQAVVIVDEADAGPALATGRTYWAAPRQGLLEVAATHGQNPWALAAANRLPHPARLVPGGAVLVPGGEEPTLALPYPLRALALGPLPTAQGRTLAIRAATDAPAQIAGRFGDAPLTFSAGDPEGRAQYALHGIYRLAEPDLYPLSVVVTPTAGAPVAFAMPVPVRAGDYGADPPLTVDEGTLDPAVTGPEADQVAALTQAVTPERYWSGVFALPSAGPLRSSFGSLRAYNGGPYESFHGGIDFAGGEDRPITAPAPGVVVFTGALTVRGNATVINHGWGVYTGYWHQSSILVKAGDRVETGQVIGYNGATGRVTGPHLHWEVWVNGVQVDPLQWLEEDVVGAG